MSQRVRKFNKKEKYTKISNSTLQNKNLSFGARGLLSYILSLPEDWELYISTLYEASPQKRTPIDKIVKELKEHDYLLKIQFKNSKGHATGITWLAFDEPELQEDILAEIATWEVVEGVVMATVYFSGNTATVDICPDVENPAAGYPAVGKPAAGKPTSTKKHNTNKYITKETVNKATGNFEKFSEEEIKKIETLMSRKKISYDEKSAEVLLAHMKKQKLDPDSFFTFTLRSMHGINSAGGLVEFLKKMEREDL